MIDLTKNHPPVSAAGAPRVGRPIVATLLLALLATIILPAASAEEGTSRNFFPFSWQDEAAEPAASDQQPTSNEAPADQPAATDASATEPSSNWLVTSPFARVSWPEIRMPEVQWSLPWSGSGEQGGNWFTAPLKRVRSTASGAVERTQTAWNRAIDKMKFALPGRDAEADDQASQLAGRTRELTLWEQVLGKDESESEPEPDNVVEMMAQERTNPQR